MTSRRNDLGVATSWRDPARAASGTLLDDRPFRLLVGYTAGVPADLITRQVADRLRVLLRQEVVVENINGASGTLAIHAAARAAPDGHTLCMIAGGTMTTNTLISTEGRQAAALVTPIGQVTSNPHVMLVHGRLPVKDVREFIDYAKARPGEVKFASPGAGSVSHLGAELFQAIAGIEGVYIPYHGGEQMLVDLAAGRVHVAYISGNGVVPMLADGSLRALGMTAPTQAPGLRDLPVLEEQGLPGFRYKSWYGLYVTAGTPPPLVEELNVVLRAALADEGLRNTLAAQGTDVMAGSPAELAALEQADIRLWSDIIERRRIVIQ